METCTTIESSYGVKISVNVKNGKYYIKKLDKLTLHFRYLKTLNAYVLYYFLSLCVMYKSFSYRCSNAILSLEDISLKYALVEHGPPYDAEA